MSTGDKYTATPLSKALSLMSSTITDVTLRSATFTLSTRGMSEAIPTLWWSVWKEVREKRYTVHMLDVSTDDPKAKLLLRILRELLDDYAHHAHWAKWEPINFFIERSRFSLPKDAKLLGTC
jgi:hypothetical protein